MGLGLGLGLGSGLGLGDAGVGHHCRHGEHVEDLIRVRVQGRGS